MSLFFEFLNYTVILFGLVAKIPQISMLQRNKNTAGMSMKSTWTELLAFLIIMSYCAKQGYALTAYLEIIAAMVQTLVLMLMMFYYQNDLNLATVTPVAGTLCTFYFLYLGIPHNQILDYLVAAVSLVLASSKIFQLQELRNTKNSENVSITRWLMVSYISLARVLTNILGVVDKALLFNAALAFVLNMAIVALAYNYRLPEVKKGSRKAD